MGFKWHRLIIVALEVMSAVLRKGKKSKAIKLFNWGSVILGRVWFKLKLSIYFHRLDVRFRH